MLERISMLELLLLVQTCAPQVAPDTMLSVIKTESNGYPFVVYDNTNKRAYHFANKEEAVKNSFSLVKEGHNLDFGLTQINLINAKKFHLSLNDVFDPCQNIKFGSLILTNAFLESSKDENSKKALLNAFSLYNTGNKKRGYHNGYVEKVIENSDTIGHSK